MIDDIYKMVDDIFLLVQNWYYRSSEDNNYIISQQWKADGIFNRHQPIVSLIETGE